MDSCACRGAALRRGGSSGEYTVGNTIASEVAFFANAPFRWGDDGEVLGFDLSDNLVEVLRGRVNEVRGEGELHEGVGFGFLGGPIEEEALGAFAVAFFKDVGVGAELALVGMKEGGRAFRFRGGLEVQEFEAAVAAHEEVHLAGEDVVVFFDGDIHLGFNDALHFGLVLVEVVHDLAEGGGLGGLADGTDVGEAEELEGFLEQLADAGFVEGVESCLSRTMR